MTEIEILERLLSTAENIRFLLYLILFCISFITGSIFMKNIFGGK